MDTYTQALALTLAIEVPIVAVCYSKIALRMAGVAAAATTLTHYAMHEPLRSLFAGSAHPIVFAELAVAAAEAVLYFASSRHEDYAAQRATMAVGVSLIANATSYAVGLYALG